MSTKRYTSYGSNKWGIVDGGLSTYEDRYIEKSTGSKLVSIIGLLIVIAVIIFCVKWFASAALVAAIVPGNPFDESQKDDDLWRIILGIIGVIVLLVGLPLSFILA
jgi:hypothetical protein